MLIRFHRYTVSGGGSFPLDMIRFDRCWPRASRDVEKLDSKELRKVELISIAAPTIARWNSFGWQVSEIQTFKGEV